VARRSLCDRWEMGQAFSNDIRRRILRTYERGNVSLRKLAERFDVSYEYVKKIRKHQRETGQMDRAPQSRHGPKSRITPEVEKQIRTEVVQQPDITLLELKERIAKSTQVEVSQSRLWLCLERLGLRRKKNLARARARQRSQPTTA
jgi:transposase